jgi:hypothetical protein
LPLILLFQGSLLILRKSGVLEAASGLKTSENGAQSFGRRQHATCSEDVLCGILHIQ